MADYISKLRIKGVPCRMRIRGAQEETYAIKIRLDEPDTPELWMISPGFLAEIVGLTNRNMWNTSGPFDPKFRQNLTETIERNYHRETHSGGSDPEEFDVIMRRLVNRYVEPMIKGLLEEGFPEDAVPVFRQFAREDFAFSIGLAIGQFWDRANNYGSH